MEFSARDIPITDCLTIVLVNSILAKLNARDLQADNEKRVGLNLSHLGARTTVMPMVRFLTLVPQCIIAETQ